MILHIPWTPVQISKFKFLELSPLHKEILEKALRTTYVPTYIDVEWFQATANNISSPYYLTFLKEDEKYLSHPHNIALHIEVQIYHT